MNFYKMNEVSIDKTFASFSMKAVRIIVTAKNHNWAFNASVSLTGFATSVIACGQAIEAN